MATVVPAKTTVRVAGALGPRPSRAAFGVREGLCGTPTSFLLPVTPGGLLRPAVC